MELRNEGQDPFQNGAQTERRPDHCRGIEIGGWGARIRTWEWRNQNPLPYRLATPHRRARDRGRTIATRTGPINALALAGAGGERLYKRLWQISECSAA